MLIIERTEQNNSPLLAVNQTDLLIGKTRERGLLRKRLFSCPRPPFGPQAEPSRDVSHNLLRGSAFRIFGQA